ncbi:MAG TPA: UbiA family prenyltransferase [Chitinophagaceae bacterium]|nr:UbiA family prenyltransferase [Chitinophagaceae bacterium]
MVKKIAAFILFSSLFIAACAVALCIQTNLQMHLPLNNFSFYCFVFGATLVQYNLHYMTKTIAARDSARLRWSLKNRNLHILLLSTGVALIVFSLFSFHLRHYIILAAMGLIAFVYSFPALPLGKRKRIKDYGLIKIITLALLWTLVTVWFPIVNLSFDRKLFLFIFFNRFFFMFVLCLLFDIRDMEVDREQNIHTIPVIAGKSNSYYIAYFTLFLMVVLSAVKFYVFGGTGVLVAMVLSAIITFIVILATKKNNSDFIYLAGIDGMMLLQFLLIYLAINF